MDGVGDNRFQYILFDPKFVVSGEHVGDPVKRAFAIHVARYSFGASVGLGPDAGGKPCAAVEWIPGLFAMFL